MNILAAAIKIDQILPPITQFIINHGVQRGRLLLRRQESGASNGSLYTMNWNLDLDGGAKLQTGVYLYRVLLTADGATTTSKAKKLVVIGNK